MTATRLSRFLFILLVAVTLVALLSAVSADYPSLLSLGPRAAIMKADTHTASALKMAPAGASALKMAPANSAASALKMAPAGTVALKMAPAYAAPMA